MDFYVLVLNASRKDQQVHNKLSLIRSQSTTVIHSSQITRIRPKGVTVLNSKAGAVAGIAL